jgi:hypothetical protein
MARTRGLKIGSVVLGLALMGLPGCATDDIEVPDLTGPSELGRAVSLTATPDVLTQDGSQARVVVDVRGPSGEPLRGVEFRLAVQTPGPSFNPGSFDTDHLVTGGDGRATALYTAPDGAPGGAAYTVSIVATPVGSNYAETLKRTVWVRLLGKPPSA